MIQRYTDHKVECGNDGFSRFRQTGKPFSPVHCITSDRNRQGRYRATATSDRQNATNGVFWASKVRVCPNRQTAKYLSTVNATSINTPIPISTTISHKKKDNSQIHHQINLRSIFKSGYQQLRGGEGYKMLEIIVNWNDTRKAVKY